MTGWLALVAWALGVSALHARERRRVALAARAGHEVRGPLSAARLALDGLERTARMEAIDLELRRAALALDDLAGAGRRRRGSELGERVDVGRLLRQAAPAWHALAAARHGGLSVQPPPRPMVVLGDPLRLTQACANLVANALEHGGGLARVRVSTSAGRVRIEVTDAGPGLPAPLHRLVAAARGRRTARGHGLAIAAAIAERHGGRLIAAPASRGARLVLDLPEAPPNARRLVRTSRSSGPSAAAPAVDSARPPVSARVSDSARSPATAPASDSARPSIVTRTPDSSGAAVRGPSSRSATSNRLS